MSTVKRTIELQADTDAELLKAASASGLTPSPHFLGQIVAVEQQLF